MIKCQTSLKGPTNHTQKEHKVYKVCGWQHEHSKFLKGQAKSPAKFSLLSIFINWNETRPFNRKEEGKGGIRMKEGREGVTGQEIRRERVDKDTSWQKKDLMKCPNFPCLGLEKTFNLFDLWWHPFSTLPDTYQQLGSGCAGVWSADMTAHVFPVNRAQLYPGNNTFSQFHDHCSQDKCLQHTQTKRNKCSQIVF